MSGRAELHHLKKSMCKILLLKAQPLKAFLRAFEGWYRVSLVTWWSSFLGICRSGWVVSQVSPEKVQWFFFWVAVAENLWNKWKLLLYPGTAGPQIAGDYMEVRQSTHNFLFVQMLQIEVQIFSYVSLHIYISPFIIMVSRSVEIVLIFLF